MKTKTLFAALLLLAVDAQATTRSSMNYTVVADVLDSGGGQASSANYSNSGSVGGIVGMSSVASPAETVKSGYIGQLYEITGLSLSAPTNNPTTVFGGYSLQIAVSALLDDSTTLGIPGAEVNPWSVIAGGASIKSISATGLVSTFGVSQISSGTVGAVYQSFSASLSFNIWPVPSGVSADLAAAGAGVQALAMNLELQGGLTVTLEDPLGNPYQGSPYEPSQGPPTQSSVPGWRFAGETAWRPSGVPVFGLPVNSSTQTAQLPLEFESIVDFGAGAVSLPAPSPAIVFISAGKMTQYSKSYSTAGLSATGSVSVMLSTNNPSLGQTPQWRFLGETSWRGSGVVGGLPFGSYIIEFPTLPGFAPVAEQDVQVAAGAGGNPEIMVTYQQVEPVSGSLPEPLPYSSVSGAAPYEFIGQITADFLVDDQGVSQPTPFMGSGIVVAPRVVLTAAHVVFDGNAGTYATYITPGTGWHFERHVGQFDPAPVIPRGVYVLDGYAAASKSLGLGDGTPASEEVDAAVAYFQEDVSNQGASGYLISNSADSATEWLLTNRKMLLAGYPVDTGQPNGTVVPGQMQATPPQPLMFATLNGASPPAPDVYVTTQITGLGGMSGGPLCVQFDDGLYYPAGIYLGGSQQCIVHGIDANVDALIQQGKQASQGGVNHLGGGSILVEPIGMTANFLTGAVTVNFGAGSPKDAGWRLSTEPATVVHASGVTLKNLSPGVKETIVFVPVAGYLAPPNYGPFTVSGGESLVLGAEYGAPPEITTTAIPIGGVGLTYSTRITATNSPTSFTGTLTDPSGNQTAISETHPSAASLNLTLNHQGVLATAPGSIIPDNAVVGTYTLAVTATNIAPVPGTANLELVIAPTGTLSISFDSSQGSVALGGVKLKPNQALPRLPQGMRVTVTASSDLPKSLFGGWTGSGTANVPESNAQLQFTMTPSVALMANFEANPYIGLAGSYSGLLKGDSDSLAARGYLAAQVTEYGYCTVSFYDGGIRYSTAGRFQVTDPSSEVATFFELIKGARGDIEAIVDLELAPGGATNSLAGGVTVNGGPLALSAQRSVFGGNSPAPPALGQKGFARYTMALPHSTGSGAPQGDGYGTVTVTPGGAVHFAGVLGDGTVVSEGTTLGSAGQWPFYALLYGNMGVITGPLTVAATGATTGTISGSLDWFKPLSKAQYYPDGFTLSSGLGDAIAVQGVSLGTTPLAGLGQATLAITGGGLSVSVPSIMASISNKGVGAATGLKGFAFSISPATGVFSGKFLDEAVPPQSHPFNGVLLPANGGTAHGFGLFKGAAYTGKTGSPPGDTGAVEF